jgi:hypothetical protein
VNRREFVKTLGAASVASASSRRAPAQEKVSAGSPKQMIVLCGESVRYDMLNCNRATGLKTPNLDRIAAQELDRYHGIDVSLQPFINIDRDVTLRRAYNTFGEDPLLTG